MVMEEEEKNKKKKRKLVKGKERTKNVHFECVCVINTDKDCDLLQNRPALSSGRTSYSENLVMIPKGIQCQYGRTD
jgi:hypothetical protein